MILLELAFKPCQQSKGVAGGARETGENLIVVEPAYLFRARFHHGFAERYLTVAGESHTRVFSDEQHGRAAHLITFFPHCVRNETIGTRLNVSQGEHLE